MDTQTVDIDTMEAGFALDALVAEKVMGLRVKQEHYPDIKYPVYKYFYDTLITPRKTIEEIWVDVPGYSTDIAAAFEIVTQFPYHEVDVGRDWDGKVWYCEIVPWGKDGAEAVGTTAPLAICRAALKLALTKEG